MDKPLPYMTAALLCEKLIQEKNDVVTLVLSSYCKAYLVRLASCSMSVVNETR